MREGETKKDKRRKYMSKDSYFKNGFKSVREEVKQDMEEQFESETVGELKSNDHVIVRDNVEVHLAKDFGFCWGVERSIAMAYEARTHFPDKKLHITNELIHNPQVNGKLQDMEVNFVPKTGGPDGGKDFSGVSDGDVVILPAFGASIEEMELFDSKNVEVVDTTCPWVSKVWNTVDMHQRRGLTSIIHGKYAHEETVATASFCETYLIVKDMGEAEYVAKYIAEGGDREEFMKKFEKAMSKDFDPDKHLVKLGLANQTTMYKKETRAIGQLFQKAQLNKYGPVDVASHYMEFDTICDATQERQDAIHDLVNNKEELGLDFILVVGGWDSSNTQHLLEIPLNAGLRAFHINEGECIGADNTITHRAMNGDVVKEEFMGRGMVRMGVTSGASTPDRAVQDALDRIFLLKKVNPELQ
ncbi:hypothetical protein TrRE_jg13305 [Triparma retinervis]|uniref:4-hydroxy-3-methylbut-2-enyl diphosphate reductase n=1 Tax=Triparma retinervis TaxID=2557542 RepID=A0A9W7E134_9STRA|nr:hypothetical protein TrRE_jg13305 [Triparma retinervis]